LRQRCLREDVREVPRRRYRFLVVGLCGRAECLSRRVRDDDRIVTLGLSLAVYRRHFFHLASAARFAISDLRSAVSRAARSLPPLRPPSRPSATAAGFFSAGVSSFGSGVMLERLG